MSRKKGQIVNIFHTKLRGITSALLEEICHDVGIEPILQPVADNNLVSSTTNTNDSARLDVSAS